MFELMRQCSDALSFIIVAFFGIKLILFLSVNLWKKVIGPTFKMGIDIPSQGKWAIVTGATDGIGLSYATKLAEQNMNILLIARTLSNLKEHSMRLRQLYGVETKFLQGDISTGKELYPKVLEAIEGLDIGVLVNNAGTTYYHPEEFHELRDGTVSDILHLNVVGFTWMIKAVLPHMVMKRKGVIINIGSALSVVPAPYLSLYSASKAFVEKFSADLALEYESKGVTVQCVFPGPVRTNMSKTRFSHFLQPLPNAFVNSALLSVGLETKTAGYNPHSLILIFYNIMKSITERGTTLILKHQLFNYYKEAIEREQASETLVATNNNRVNE